MEITTQNLHQAENAIRDILFMFLDMVRSYSGFGHNVDCGNFSPLDFIDAVVYEPEGYTFSLDIKLLQSGASIALLSILVNAWDEFDSSDVPIWPVIKEIETAYRQGRFSHFPDIEKAIGLGLGDNQDAFRQQLPIIYSAYVRQFFCNVADKC